MRQVFARDGLLSKALAGYEFRPMQLQMAEAVAEAIKERRPTIIEAGTGTGKTLAYLVPLAGSGHKSLVSTGTKTLQDQLVEHDIPFVRRHLYPRLQAVAMKGRANYLCRYRLERATRQPQLLPDAAAVPWEELSKWAGQTATGDRAEVEWMPDDFAPWQRLHAGAEHCLGQHCPLLEDCFLTRLRQRAAAADLVVVNHHLFFADLAVRTGGFGQVIPGHEVVVFDEAHLLEEAATQYFSVHLSSYQVRELVADISAELTAAGLFTDEFSRSLAAVEAASSQLFAALPEADTRTVLPPPGADADLESSMSQLELLLGQLAAGIGKYGSEHEPLDACRRRLLEMGEKLALFRRQDDHHRVYWYERRGRAIFLWAAPVKMAPILSEVLFSQRRPYIFTSATIAIAGETSFFKARLGLDAATSDLVLPSPFSYQEQVLIYLPKGLPLPSSPRFAAAVTEEIAAILKETGGRALLLFTSNRNLQAVHQGLRQRVDYPIMVQGEQPKHTLIERFRRQTASVLLGTASFWQGVDLPGETLSCVVVDKLPFAVPSDPLIAARLQAIAAEGGNPFWEYQVPQAVLQLRQGLGRLIRRRTDRGVLCVLDQRLFTRPYGRVFLESLPKGAITHNRADIGRFLAREADE